MTWNPQRYEQFADHRLRPGLDLLAQVGGFSPRRVVDLGCGTGRLTRIIAERFPDAHVVGIDASAEMLAGAPTDVPNLRWRRQDLASWTPDVSYGLIFSNAALHWVDDHPVLLRRLAQALPAGGTLAVQMPDNWDQPTHSIPADILGDPEYADVADALLRDRVAKPDDYRRWLGSDLVVDLWTTTYHHVLTGTDPVLDWVLGSVLTPVVSRLDDRRRRRFLGECARRYREAYPPQADGTTMLPFRRLFVVARRR